MTQDCKKVRKLWEKLKKKYDVKEYKNEKWLKNNGWYNLPSEDHNFLMPLTWGRFKEEQILNFWNKIRESFDKLGKRLHELTREDIDRLGYPYPWQREFLERLVQYLKKNNITMDDLANRLKKMDYEEAKLELQSILKTESSKIIECYMRDYLLLPAFPIDSRVKKVLKKYSIPTDSSLIVKCCKELGIDVKAFNRMVLEEGSKNLKLNQIIP